ncbi:hypothetical protein Skr01_25210 [Sphaerisporangium krabiense]|nr:hypothetical protein Skr01_25210 [Sphaerisporangium krabiense]
MGFLSRLLAGPLSRDRKRKRRSRYRGPFIPIIGPASRPHRPPDPHPSSDIERFIPAIGYFVPREPPVPPELSVPRGLFMRRGLFVRRRLFLHRGTFRAVLGGTCLCGVGVIVERQGRFGPFLGCTEWRPGDFGCKLAWLMNGDRIPPPYRNRYR